MTLFGKVELKFLARSSKYLSPVFIIIGLTGMVHQRFYTSGGWFSWEQVWHHELFIVMSFAFGAGILLGGILRRRK